MAMADRFDSPMCFNAALSLPVFWTFDLAKSSDLFMEIVNSPFSHMPRWSDITFKAFDDFANNLVMVSPPHSTWDTFKTLTQNEHGKQVLVHLSQKKNGLEDKILRKSADKIRLDKISKTLQLASMFFMTPDMLTDSEKLNTFVEWTSAVARGNVFQNTYKFADTQYIFKGLVCRFLHTTKSKNCTNEQLYELAKQHYDCYYRTKGDDWPKHIVLDWCKTMEIEETSCLKRQHS